MTERKGGFDPSHLVPMGLFREGTHNDTEIMAKSPSGKEVLIKVHPVRVSDGTLFVPKLGQDKSVMQTLFPPRRHSI